MNSKTSFTTSILIFVITIIILLTLITLEKEKIDIEKNDLCVSNNYVKYIASVKKTSYIQCLTVDNQIKIIKYEMEDDNLFFMLTSILKLDKLIVFMLLFTQIIMSGLFTIASILDLFSEK